MQKEDRKSIPNKIALFSSMETRFEHNETLILYQQSHLTSIVDSTMSLISIAIYLENLANYFVLSKK